VPELGSIFISYASHDMDRVLPIVRHLEAAGMPVWRDHKRILGGGNYGPEIARAIRESRWLMLMCSNASMQCRYAQGTGAAHGPCGRPPAVQPSALLGALICQGETAPLGSVPIVSG
jgi:hypothetical protein